MYMLPIVMRDAKRSAEAELQRGAHIAFVRKRYAVTIATCIAREAKDFAQSSGWSEVKAARFLWSMACGVIAPRLCDFAVTRERLGAQILAIAKERLTV